MLMIMTTWWRGSRYLFEKTRKSEIPLDELVRQLSDKPPPTVTGTAVFLTGDPESAPTALLHSLKHYKVLHEQNVILSVVTAPQPHVRPSERVTIEELEPAVQAGEAEVRLHGAAQRAEGAGADAARWAGPSTS